MQILSKGFKLPQTGDFGDVWFPALEDNIQQENDHNHNGINSEKIESGDMLVTTASVLSGAFVDQGNGYYRATVTTPGGVDPAIYNIVVRDPTTKEPIYLKQERLSATQFYLYTNFVQNFEVVYGV